MKLLQILLIPLLLCGCWRYGEGRTLGYVTTIENGIFWDYVWIRAELESSQTNAYCIEKDNEELKEELSETSRLKQRIMLRFYNHISFASRVDPGGEAVSFTIIE